MGAIRMRVQTADTNITTIHTTSVHTAFYKTLIDGLESCGLLVYYCDVCIICLDSHSDGTHLLQRIHWLTSDVILHFSKSVLMKKQIHLHFGWPEGFFFFFHFWVNYSFNQKQHLVQFRPLQ